MALSDLQTAEPAAITTCMAGAHSNCRTCDQCQDAGETYSTNTLDNAVSVTSPS